MTLLQHLRQADPQHTVMLNVDLRRNRRNPGQIPALGYAMLFNAGPGEYFVAGMDVQVTFYPCTAGFAASTTD